MWYPECELRELKVAMQLHNQNSDKCDFTTSGPTIKGAMLLITCSRGWALNAATPKDAVNS